MDQLKEHAGLLVAFVLQYFLADFRFGTFAGESMIPMIIGQMFGADYIEKATDSPFRLKVIE